MDLLYIKMNRIVLHKEEQWNVLSSVPNIYIPIPWLQNA